MFVGEREAWLTPEVQLRPKKTYGQTGAKQGCGLSQAVSSPLLPGVKTWHSNRVVILIFATLLTSNGLLAEAIKIGGLLIKKMNLLN